MEKVTVEAVDPAVPAEGVERRALSEPLGTSGVSVNRYTVSPGEALPAGLHAHADQEEVFVVLAGTATFETLDGEVTVGTDEAIRFAPGEFQSGHNGGDGPLVVLALGAPRGSDDVRLPVACPACGGEEVRLETGGGEPAFVCPACGAERIARPCPECGDEDLRVTLGEGDGTVVRCWGCEATFDEPPVRNPG